MNEYEEIILERMLSLISAEYKLSDVQVLVSPDRKEIDVVFNDRVYTAYDYKDDHLWDRERFVLVHQEAYWDEITEREELCERELFMCPSIVDLAKRIVETDISMLLYGMGIHKTDEEIEHEENHSLEEAPF